MFRCLLFPTLFLQIGVSHNRLSQKPIIRLFNDWPDCNTGAPLENMTKMSYETYQDALPKANPVPNAWAPFTSKIDWEIAMWARLRGLSSTVEGCRGSQVGKRVWESLFSVPACPPHPTPPPLPFSLF